MRLVVLGKSPAWPDPGGACSGYLIEQDGFTVLLDCGAGVFGKLTECQDYLTLGAVLISHLHADHILDLVPFSYGLHLSPRRTEPPRRPPLHAPPGAGQALARLGSCWNDSELISQAFDLREYDPERALDVGPLTVRFCPVPHYTQTFACELAADGRRITFGADCGPNPTLEEFARGTNLLIAEATLSEPDADVPRGHMTPFEAGEMGRRAQAQRLLVSHFSDELGVEWVREESARGYAGPIDLATVGAEYAV